MNELYTAAIASFNHQFFIIVGGLATICMIISFVVAIYLVVKGVIPVLYRLGIGLSQRRIAIFSSSEYENLSSMLVESKIFSSKNITRINTSDIAKAEKETIFLVHWKDYKEYIDQILAIKKDSTALIVYAPKKDGRVEDEDADKLNEHRNTVLVNFRGRLLNDILTSLITTSYDKKR